MTTLSTTGLNDAVAVFDGTERFYFPIAAIGSFYAHGDKYMRIQSNGNETLVSFDSEAERDAAILSLVGLF